jgi:hypothetical protein
VCPHYGVTTSLGKIRTTKKKKTKKKMMMKLDVVDDKNAVEKT